MSSSSGPRGLSRTQLSFLLAAALFASLYFFWYQKTCFRYQFMSGTATCSKVDTFYMGPQNEYKLPYYCNEVILDPSHPNADSLRIYLKHHCFKLEKTCPCEPPYELWKHLDVDGIDLGTIVQKPPSAGGIENGSGLMVNAVIDLEPPVAAGDYTKYLDSLPVASTCTPTDTVRLAIIDSGVDTSRDASSSILRRFGWTPYNQSSKCIPNDKHQGLNMVDLQALREPEDLHGHGTSVNSVAAGISNPNFKKSLPLKILNIRFTRDHGKSGSLFDALCGLNYALTQNPQIINISWGFIFLNEVQTAYMDVTLAKMFNQLLNVARERNVLVIAGMGNDSKQLTTQLKFYPASQVQLHDNGLSIGALGSELPPNELASFSNYSDASDHLMTLAAPGAYILCAQPMYLQAALSPSIPPTGYQRKSGTSFAAPLVSRLAAMIISIHHYPAPHLVKARLLSCTAPVKPRGNAVFLFNALNSDSVKIHLCHPISGSSIPAL